MSTSEPEAAKTKADTKASAKKTKPKRSATTAKPKSATAPLEDGNVRLFVNLGLRDRVTEESLIDDIAELAGLLPEDFLGVDLRPRHAYLTLPAEFASDLTR